jgi:hypothetical protein
MRASYCRREHPVLLERKDCTLAAWYPLHLRTLAPEGRMTVTLWLLPFERLPLFSFPRFPGFF